MATRRSSTCRLEPLSEPVGCCGAMARAGSAINGAAPAPLACVRAPAVPALPGAARHLQAGAQQGEQGAGRPGHVRGAGAALATPATSRRRRTSQGTSHGVALGALTSGGGSHEGWRGMAGGGPQQEARRDTAPGTAGHLQRWRLTLRRHEAHGGMVAGVQVVPAHHGAVCAAAHGAARGAPRRAGPGAPAQPGAGARQRRRTLGEEGGGGAQHGQRGPHGRLAPPHLPAQTSQTSGRNDRILPALAPLSRRRSSCCATAASSARRCCCRSSSSSSSARTSSSGSCSSSTSSLVSE